MKNNSFKVKLEWKKRRIRYVVSNSVIGKMFMKLCCEFKELFWLGICVGILVVVVNLLIF